MSTIDDIDDITPYDERDDREPIRAGTNLKRLEPVVYASAAQVAYWQVIEQAAREVISELEDVTANPWQNEATKALRAALEAKP